MQDVKDKFEQNLDEKIVILQDCQKKHNLQSCLQCERMIDCEIRKDYVDSVYTSMNKGISGSFNFEAE